MNSDEPYSGLAANPFSTRYTRPGKLPFIFEPGWDAARIIQALTLHHGRGAIVGPHGSGKSTLLSELLDAFLAMGLNISYSVLHAGEKHWRRLPDSRWNSKTIVVIDGYEQLSWWSRLRLKMACRWSGASLLVSSHCPVRGLPTLYRTSSDLNVARILAQRLLAADSSPISELQITSAFESCGGNLREMWFKLFDIYEQMKNS